MPSTTLYKAFETAAPPYTDLAMRLLFGTILHAGPCRYRIREIEFYADNDPYTHQGDEQVSTCAGWYFHRTGPGGGWKGGTFMGVDISFAPVGTAGGVLIRGLSRCEDEEEDPGLYFDGSCNCCRELLRACGVSKIKDLVDMQEFSLDALAENAMLRLEESQTAIPISPGLEMEWKASSRDLTELDPIVGVLASELLSLPDACDELGLRASAESAVAKVSEFSAAGLSDDEKGAVYLYTTNCLYRRLNEALRHPNRNKATVYFQYLRLFFEAYSKMKAKPIAIYRGIRKDLASQYAVGNEVTWWNVSSCTPNINVAKNFGGGAVGGTLFHVKAKTAVPIMHLSAYQSEEEYVLAPGTVLKVNKVKAKPGSAVQIFLEEVEGKRLVN